MHPKHHQDAALPQSCDKVVERVKCTPPTILPADCRERRVGKKKQRVQRQPHSIEAVELQKVEVLLDSVLVELVYTAILLRARPTRASYEELLR